MTDVGLWGTDFSAISVLSLKEIFEQQGALLPGLTNGAASVEVVKMKNDLLFDKSFIFRFYILGKYINNYRFNVCTFAHDVDIYPTLVRLSTDIAGELQFSSDPKRAIQLDNSDDAMELVKKVLTSDRIKRIVGGIMKMTSDDDIPF